MFQQTKAAPRLRSPRLSLQRRYGVLTTALLALALAVGFLTGAPPPAQAATKTYPVVVNHNGLRVRERPTTASRHVASLFRGDRVRIICTTTGPSIRGPLGRSRVWDKIGKNRWVPDTFIRTGSNRAVAPRCKSGRSVTPPHAAPRFHAWEDGPGGIRHHAAVTFRASDLHNGRHVKRVYVRLERSNCWLYPDGDTGQVVSVSARSPRDTTTYRVERLHLRFPQLQMSHAVSLGRRGILLNTTELFLQPEHPCSVGLAPHRYKRLRPGPC